LSFVWAVNAAGRAVGYANDATGQIHPVLFSGGAVTDLGNLPGDQGGDARGINAAGLIVGDSVNAHLARGTAVLFSGGTVTSLGFLAGNTSSASAINAAGVAAGYSSTGPTAGNPHAVLFQGGTVTDLGVLPGGTFSVAYALNDRGVAAGISDSGGSSIPGHAALFYHNKVIDLGGLGGTYSVAFGINNNGQAVGQATALDGHLYATLYFRNKVINLGVLPGAVSHTAFDLSSARAINDAGLAVGYSNDPSGQRRAVLFSHGALFDLNKQVLPGSPFLLLTEATGINARGQIVGTGVTRSGAEHAFLLTPEGPFSPTPEPSSLVLLSLVTLGLAGYRWRCGRRC
jgi:probable HAF family extracellular repeat protein